MTGNRVAHAAAVAQLHAAGAVQLLAPLLRRSRSIVIDAATVIDIFISEVEGSPYEAVVDAGCIPGLAALLRWQSHRALMPYSALFILARQSRRSCEIIAAEALPGLICALRNEDVGDGCAARIIAIMLHEAARPYFGSDGGVECGYAAAANFLRGLAQSLAAAGAVTPLVRLLSKPAKEACSSAALTANASAVAALMQLFNSGLPELDTRLTNQVVAEGAIKPLVAMLLQARLETAHQAAELLQVCIARLTLQSHFIILLYQAFHVVNACRQSCLTARHANCDAALATHHGNQQGENLVNLLPVGDW